MPIVDQESRSDGRGLALVCGIAAAVVLLGVLLLAGGLFTVGVVRPGPAATATPMATGTGSSGWGSSPNQAIPDGSSAGTAVEMPSPTGEPRAVVRSVALAVTLQHPRPQDVRIVLVHPDGTRAVLRREGTAGELRATYEGAVMQPFDGRPAGGDWKLVVADVKKGKAGRVREVSLDVDYAW